MKDRQKRRLLQAMAAAPLLPLPRARAKSGKPAPEREQTIDFPALTALVDAIVPADDTPGAVAAGVHSQMRDVIARDRWQRQIYERGFEVFNTIARARDGKPFAHLDLQQRVDLLQSLLRSQKSEHAAGLQCFLNAREEVLRRFYSSPAGWNILGYQPPGRGYDN